MPSKDLPDQDAAAVATNDSVGTQSSAEPARGFIAWTKAHRLKAMLAIGGATSLLIAAAFASWLLFMAPKPRPIEELVTMDQILQALDRRAFAKVQVLAKRAQEQDTLKAEEQGGPAFALGAVAAHEAESSTGKDRAKLFLLASRYLEEANKRGFPADRNAEGLYLLGKSLCESNQIQAGRSVLFSALKTSPQYRGEILALLTNAYLSDFPPKLVQALEQNTLLLDDKKISEAKRQEALLVRSQILLDMGKIDECSAALDQIPAQSKNPEAAVQRGRVMMYEAQALKKKTPPSDTDQQKAGEKLQEAIQTFRFALGQDAGGGKAARQAMYLIGLCYLESNDNQTALEHFARTFNLCPDTPEGIAAGFQAAELYRRLGRDIDALGEYRRVLGAIPDPATYNNPWLSLDQLKSGVLAAYQQYLSAQKFEFALQIVRIMRSLFPADQSLLFQAEAHGVWGQTLLSQADKGPRNKVESIRRLGREQFRRAGSCYAKLASTLPANKTFTDQLWNGATSYLKGQDYRNAVHMFQMYLKNEAQRRHTQALAGLGESLLAAGQLDKALDMLKECIDLYPRDAAACRARLLASRAYEEKGDCPSAENMLLDNLNGDYLTPESKEWRDSLIGLGELLYAQGQCAAAVRRLEEYVKRYPDLPDAVQARYMMAECYYKLAAEIQDKLKKDLTGNTRTVLARQIQERYSQALEQYKQVQETLAKDRDAAELTPVNKEILRNCCFAVGNVLFAQGDYEAAVKAYSTAVNRYQNCPEVLVAYVQIAAAYRNLNNPREAKNALEQAKFALGRMKPDAAFESTTNYSRQQWAQRLDLLSSL
jgi:tetratricopeptide (TPR) repeat protein